MTDPYFIAANCIERLFEDYRKHPKLIVACDFDDTVFDYHEKGHTYPRVIDLLKECQEMGFYIVMFTASPKEKYEFIEKYMEEYGIKIASINKNPIELPYGNDGKIFFNILLDDRAGLAYSCAILDMTIQKIKEFQELNKEAQAQNAA